MFVKCKFSHDSLKSVSVSAGVIGPLGENISNNNGTSPASTTSPATTTSQGSTDNQTSATSEIQTVFGKSNLDGDDDLVVVFVDDDEQDP